MELLNTRLNASLLGSDGKTLVNQFAFWEKKHTMP
jgi:hypothetical protein